MSQISQPIKQLQIGPQFNTKSTKVVPHNILSRDQKIFILHPQHRGKNNE